MSFDSSHATGASVALTRMLLRKKKRSLTFAEFIAGAIATALLLVVALTLRSMQPEGLDYVQIAIASISRGSAV
jgi:hypothetical protein